jgi:hypothetical protein
MLRTPDGHGRLELTTFHTPSTDGGYQRAPANASGIRHIAFAVDDIDAVLAYSGIVAMPCAAEPRPMTPNSTASPEAQTRGPPTSPNMAMPRGTRPDRYIR